MLRMRMGARIDGFGLDLGLKWLNGCMDLVVAEGCHADVGASVGRCRCFACLALARQGQSQGLGSFGVAAQRRQAPGEIETLTLKKCRL